MITRRLIVVTPVLLIAGIVVQVIALIVVILLLVPCLIWPQILNGPYRWITTAGARTMARAIIGRKTGTRPKAETAAG
jgi:hypothetical protein